LPPSASRTCMRASLLGIDLIRSRPVLRRHLVSISTL
jgi:hypothetical protein